MKSTLIFLHGGPGFRNYLKPFFQELESSFNCVFYDQLRGSEITLEKLLTQLDLQIGSAQGNIVLVGHSWGGVLATEYASRYSGKISGLILMNTGLSHQQWFDEFHLELKNRDLENADLADIFLTESEKAVGLDFLKEEEKHFSKETFDHLTETYIRNYHLVDALSSLQLPILNIYCDADIRFPARVGRSFKKWNPNIIEMEIRGAGHFPFLLPNVRLKIIQAINEFRCALFFYLFLVNNNKYL